MQNKKKLINQIRLCLWIENAKNYKKQQKNQNKKYNIQKKLKQKNYKKYENSKTKLLQEGENHKNEIEKIRAYNNSLKDELGKLLEGRR